MAYLRPCPHCCDTAKLMQTADDDWLVSCVNEECKAHVGYFLTDFEARMAWNMRPLSDEAYLTRLAERFCATSLPPTVAADLCSIDAGYPHLRTGANLLTVDEARAMLRQVLLAEVSA